MKLGALHIFGLLALSLAAVSGCDRATPRPPETSAEERVFLQELSDLHASRRYEDGLIRAVEYLEQHPQAPEVHHAIAVFQVSLGQHHAAVASFQNELELNPQHLGSHLGLALTYSTLGRYEDALEHLDRAQGVAPDDTRVGFQLGSVLSKLGRFDEAEEHLLAVLSSLDSPAVYYEMALTSQRRGDFEEAAHRYRRVLEKDPQHLSALNGLAQALLQLGQEASGQQLLSHYQNLSRLFQRRSQLDQECRSALATPPVCVELARVHLQLGRDDEARVAFERALDIDRESFTAALGLGALLLRMGDLDLASKWTIQALALAPHDPRSLFQLGLLRVRKGEFAAAEKALSSSREARSWTVENYIHLGDAWLTAGEHKRAETIHLEGLRLNEFHPALLSGLTRARLDAGDLPGAEATVRRILATQPELQSAWLLLAVAEARQGDPAEAQRAFEKAVDAADARYDRESARRMLLSQVVEIPGGSEIVGAF